MKIFKCILFSLLLISNHPIIGQSSVKVWQDSIALNVNNNINIALHQKIAEYYFESDYTKSIDELEKIVDIYRKDNQPQSQIETYQNISDIYLQNNERIKAVEYLNRALEIANDLQNDTIKGDLYKSLGYAYEQKGNYDKAIENYLASLTYKEKLLDKQGQASNYNSLGLIYYYQTNYTFALKNFKKALKLVKEIDFKFGIASILTNMANIYMERDNDKIDSINIAISYYEKSLEIDEAMDDKYSIASTLHNIGVSHTAKTTPLNQRIDQLKKKKISDTISPLKIDSLDRLIEDYQQSIDLEFDTALIYYFKSIDIKNDINDSVDMAITYLNISVIINKQKKYKEALDYLKIAKKISIDFKLIETLAQIYDEMSFVYANLKDYANAYDYKVSYDEVKDSLEKTNLNKSLAELQEKYETNKKEEEIEKNKLKIKQQTTIQYALIVFISLLVVLAFVILRGYRNKRRANKLLEEQKHQIEIQKDEIEEKNKDIMDSINYARRIQQAIMQPQEIINQIIPHNFILFKPRDVVSGDFYWIEQKNNKKFITAVDCTGHGVPGAFMSIVGANGLDKAVNDLSVYHPCEILDKLSLIVENSLRQKGKTTVKDGMDMSMLMFDEDSHMIEFAGANNPLYITRNKNEKLIINGKVKEPSLESDTHCLYEIKGDKQPIGAIENRQKFLNYTFEGLKGDRYFLFSDGFADQFGGPKNKKFMYKSFKRLLLNLCQQNILNTGELLDKTFEEWKGDNEQIDDICVIGVAKE